MRFKRRHPRQTVHAEPEVRPELVGFSEDDPWLYEFYDQTGDLIYLHDADCTKIEFEPISEQLRLTFAFGGVAYVEGCLTNADVTFTFDGVRIIYCSHDGNAIPDEFGDRRGQVSDLSWYGNQRFTLSLVDLHMEFRASRIEYAITRH